MIRWLRKQVDRAWIFCDGSTGALSNDNGQVVNPAKAANDQPLPLTCAAAAVARADDGCILEWSWQQLPQLTNNEAEYAGLLLGLALAQRLRVQEAICVLDSEIVVGQMAGRFAVRSARLRHWHQQATIAVRELPAVRYIQIPREWNRLADGLAAQSSIAWPAFRATLAQRDQRV